jgi:alanine racemase
MHLNAVDPGKLIYGIHSPRSGRSKIQLRHAFQSLKTRIILKKKVKPGTPFDGKARFPLKEGMQVGIIPLGWGDGLPRYPLNRGEVLVGGKRVRVLGSQYVEHARIDLTEVPEAELGDEVVVIGRQGTEEITPEEVADLCGLGGSGMIRAVRENVPRVYFRRGRPWKVKTILGEGDL